MTAGFSIDKFPNDKDYAKLSQILADAGFVLPAFEQNADIAAGSSLRRSPLVSANRRLAVGLATKLFDYQFLAAVQNTNLWRHLFTTMTMTQGAGTLLMNANATTTTTTGCLLSTWRQINFPGNGVVSIEIDLLFTVTPPANQEVIVGFFPHASPTALPTDGAYFKYSTAGLFGVVNFNGVETATAQLLAPAAFTNNKMYTLKLDVSNGGVDFWRDDTFLGTLAPPDANGTPFNFGALPVSLQERNTNTVVAPMQAKVASITVTQRDLQTAKPWAEQQCAAGLAAYHGSEGGTIGTRALYANNQAAGAGAAMTNTTASLGVGLGGQFSIQPTLAQGTDGILCSYQVPAGSVNEPARSLHILGVWITGVVTAVFTGGPVLYAYSLAYGHTAVSMATVETGSFVTATAKAPRRIALGIETYVVTAPVGTKGQGIYVAFKAPIVVNPGEFVAVCAKNLGTVTSAGVLCAIVGFDAYLE